MPLTPKLDTEALIVSAITASVFAVAALSIDNDLGGRLIGVGLLAYAVVVLGYSWWTGS